MKSTDPNVTATKKNGFVHFLCRGFWDVPRMIFFRHEGKNLFLYSPFDDDLDEYTSDYRIYLMPEDFDAAALDVNAFKDWAKLPESAIEELGSVPVSAVVFDREKRKKIRWPAG